MMEIRIIHDCRQWNAFVTQQPSGERLQTFEWGAFLSGRGHIVYHLGAFEDGKLVGTMLLSLARAPLPFPFTLLNLKWAYCPREANIIATHPQALNALLAEAHDIARRERAILLRLEPNLANERDELIHQSSMVQQASGVVNTYQALETGILTCDYIYRSLLYRIWMFLAKDGQAARRLERQQVFPPLTQSQTAPVEQPQYALSQSGHH